LSLTLPVQHRNAPVHRCVCSDAYGGTGTVDEDCEVAVGSSFTPLRRLPQSLLNVSRAQTLLEVSGGQTIFGKTSDIS
jgi:hypothetical protein